MPRSTAYHPEARDAVPPEERPVPEGRAPVGAGTDEEPVGRIRTAPAESPSHGEGRRKVWARPRHRGVRTAAGRVRRLMQEHHLQAPRRGGHPRGPGAHDGTVAAEEPDTMGGAGTTTAVTTGEGTAHAFVAVDHCTRQCAGPHAAQGGDRSEAPEPPRRGVRGHFGRLGAEVADGLTIRHDRGDAPMSGDSPRELGPLGMASSPSFAREPEGDGRVERLIRTPKEQVLWVRAFATAAEPVEALGEFKRADEERWLIERHGHRPPSQVRAGRAGGVPAAA